MSKLLFTRRIDDARIIAAAMAAAMSLFAFQAEAANTITFGANNNSCGGAVMCSTDGTHGYTKDGTGQAFNLSTINQWFQIDVNGSSELSGQPAEPDKGSGGFLVVNDTGSAISSFSLTITDDFTAKTASVHNCSGAQKGNICDNFTAHGGSGSYHFNTKLSGADWDRCTQGTTNGQTCTGGSGGVAADFSPNSVTYTWTGQNGSTIPAGSYFVISFSGWNNDGWATIQTPQGPKAFITNTGPDGTGNTVSVIDTSSNTVTATITVGPNPQGVAVSPYGSHVYIANTLSNNVMVIDTATNAITATIPVGTSDYSLAVTPDGSKLYVTNAGSFTVSVIDTATNAVTATIPVGYEPIGVAVTPDGSKVYVANDRTSDSTVSVIDTASDTEITKIRVGANPSGLAVTPDGGRVYVANSHGDSVSVIDTASNMVTDTINVGYFPQQVAVSPDGNKVFVGNRRGGSVSVIDTASNMLITTIQTEQPDGISFTPDGSRVYVCNDLYDGSVSVIDANSYAVIATIPVGSQPVSFGNFIQP